eukprot:UN00232
MSKLFILALISLILAVVVSAADFDETHGSIAVGNQFAFAGRIETAAAINTTKMEFSLAPQDIEWPSSAIIKNVALQFRRHHCNCFIASFNIAQNDTFSIVNYPLQFPYPIEDEAMNYQATVTFVDAEGKLQIQEYGWTLVIQHAGGVSSTEFSVEYRQEFATVVTTAAPRQAIGNDTDITPIFPSFLLSNLNASVFTSAPAFMKLAAIGRFQFDTTKATTATCYINNRPVTATLGGEGLATYITLDLTKLTGFVTGEFVAVRCDDKAVMYPTNAIPYYKFDQAWLSVDFYTTTQAALGVGVLVKIINAPDTTPKALTAKGYIDEDVMYCDFTLSYDNEKKLSGDETVDIFFNGLTGNFTAQKLRVDLLPTVYDEKTAKAIPLSLDVNQYDVANGDVFTGVGAQNITLRANKIKTKGSIDIKAFVPLTGADINPEVKRDYQCVAVISHPNKDADWSRTLNYTTVGDILLQEPLAQNISVKTDLKKLDTEFVITLNDVAKAAAPRTELSVQLPMSNFIFDGNYTSCKLTVANKTYAFPAAGPDGATKNRTDILNFPISEEIDALLTGADVEIACPGAKMTQKNPQYEFVHRSTLVHVVLQQKGSAAQQSITAVLPMKQSTKTLYIIYGIFIAIMILALAVMVICLGRCAIATCSKKSRAQNERSQSLILNGGAYTLE